MLALFALGIIILKQFPATIESYYSNGLYPIICKLIHPFFNLFPFSVGDLLYAIAVIALLYAAVKMIRLLILRRYKPLLYLLSNTVIALQIAWLWFNLAWGINYYRPSAAKRLNLQDSTFKNADLRLITELMIDSVNKSRLALTAKDFKPSDKQIFFTAQQAVNQLSRSNKNFYTYQPKIKPSLLTALMNYLGTAGYFNPFTSETQLNYQMPVFLKPVIACHEMSHQAGFNAEDEANFAGYLAGVSSSDKLLKYSAYYLGTAEFMQALHQQDSVQYKLLKLRLSKSVLADFKTDRTYWLTYQGKLNRISGTLYDRFLKANNQPQGIKNYNRMVRLVMGWQFKYHNFKIQVKNNKRVS